MRISKILVCVSLLFVSACTVNHGDFTVLTNKIVSTSDFDLGSGARIHHVNGDDTTHIIFLIPIGIPKLSEALNDAFEKADADVMTDVTVRSGYFWIPYIYGQQWWSVDGDAIKTRKNWIIRIKSSKAARMKNFAWLSAYFLHK